MADSEFTLLAQIRADSAEFVKAVRAAQAENDRFHRNIERTSKKAERFLTGISRGFGLAVGAYGVGKFFREIAKNADESSESIGHLEMSWNRLKKTFSTRLLENEHVKANLDALSGFLETMGVLMERGVRAAHINAISRGPFFGELSSGLHSADRSEFRTATDIDFAASAARRFGIRQFLPFERRSAGLLGGDRKSEEAQAREIAAAEERRAEESLDLLRQANAAAEADEASSLRERFAQWEELQKAKADRQEEEKRTYSKHAAELAAVHERSLGVRGAVGKGLAEYADFARDKLARVRDAAVSSMFGLEDAIVRTVTTGKLAFKEFADAVIADLARIAVQQSITGPLAAALGGVLGGTAAATAGGAPVPAARVAAREVNVSVVNESGSRVTARQASDGSGAVAVEVVVGNLAAGDVRARGTLAQALEQTYGLSRRGG